jgi:hypothetical protein
MLTRPSRCSQNRHPAAWQRPSPSRPLDLPYPLPHPHGVIFGHGALGLHRKHPVQILAAHPSSFATAPPQQQPGAAPGSTQRALQEGEELRKQGSAESYRKAIEKYKEVLILFRVEGNRTGEALLLNNIGFVYHGLGNRQKALDYCNRALLLARAVSDRAGEVVSLGLKAWVERDTEQLRYCPILNWGTTEADEDVIVSQVFTSNLSSRLGGK